MSVAERPARAVVWICHAWSSADSARREASRTESPSATTCTRRGGSIGTGTRRATSVSSRLSVAARNVLSSTAAGTISTPWIGCVPL